MRKFLAVVKREYIQRVRTKFFVVATILGPVLMAGFTIVPAMMFSIKSGGPTRLAIVDQTGKMYERVAKEIVSGKEAKTNVATMEPRSQPGGPGNAKEQVNQAGKLIQPTFVVEQVRVDKRSPDDVRRELETRVQNRELEGYLILPPNLLKDGQPEFRARNTADLFTKSNVESAISRAVRGQRLVEAGIDEKTVARASEPVDLKTIEAGGKESKGEASFFFVFGIGLLIYMSVLLYGQFVLGAVIEEKETRIAEILFSSMRSFPLMMGKLIGVSLVALTQLGIWAMAFLIFSLWAAGGTVWCKRDNGTWGPNYANVMGNLMGAAVSNLYYPAADRTVGETLERGFTVTAQAIIGSEVIEFWPDMVRHHKRKQAEKLARQGIQTPTPQATPPQP